MSGGLRTSPDPSLSESEAPSRAPECHSPQVHNADGRQGSPLHHGDPLASSSGLLPSSRHEQYDRPSSMLVFRFALRGEAGHLRPFSTGSRVPAHTFLHGAGGRHPHEGARTLSFCSRSPPHEANPFLHDFKLQRTSSITQCGGKSTMMERPPPSTPVGPASFAFSSRSAYPPSPSPAISPSTEKSRLDFHDNGSRDSVLRHDFAYPPHSQFPLARRGTIVTEPVLGGHGHEHGHLYGHEHAAGHSSGSEEAAGEPLSPRVSSSNRFTNDLGAPSPLRSRSLLYARHRGRTLPQ